MGEVVTWVGEVTTPILPPPSQDHHHPGQDHPPEGKVIDLSPPPPQPRTSSPKEGKVIDLPSPRIHTGTTVNGRAVHILLECILVCNGYYTEAEAAPSAQ